MLKNPSLVRYKAQRISENPEIENLGKKWTEFKELFGTFSERKRGLKDMQGTKMV